MSAHTKTKLRRWGFYLDPAVLAALEDVRDRDGVPVAEQVRRAVLLWLEARGVAIPKATQSAASAPIRRGRKGGSK